MSARYDTAISRRALLKGAAALVIGTYLAPRVLANAGQASPKFVANAFVRIDADDTVTVLVKHIEFGQGPLTGLTTLVAEELDADWEQMRAAEAPAKAALYNNLLWGPLQGTGGSSSIANCYQQMRKAGAAARALLVQAAAEAWEVAGSEITIDRGVLRHAASGRSGRFGQFVEAASRLPVPQEAPLKSASAFRFIGREGAVKRLDTLDKTTGKTQFTCDIDEPGMLTVVVERPPRFGGKVASFDATAARAVRGVVEVKEIPYGVAVYATGMWAALKGRKALKIAWDESGAERRSTEQIVEYLRTLATRPGTVAAAHGDVDAQLKGEGRIIESEYVFPYLAHAPMEPLDGFMVWDGKRVKARYGSQVQTLDQMQIGPVFGLKPEQIEIETLFAGGSFGRRIDLGKDLVAELAAATKAIGPNHPVKLLWSREDDLCGGFYRPMTLHRLRGAIRDGKIIAWSNTIAGQSFVMGTAFEASGVRNDVHLSIVEGAAHIPYDIAHFRCDMHAATVGVPTSSWRSVSHTHTGYAVECFIDELLEAAGQDPVSGRLALMGKAPRQARVLREVAAMVNWSGSTPPKDRARGVAVVESFGTSVAQIAEVSLGERGEPRVHKVWCAVDCGVAVNPDIIRAQMEGGIGFGLGHILFAEVGLEEGRPVQHNFDTYRSLRINEMPDIEVRIIQSAEKPTGVGEPGVPPIGPAVANALARLGGKRPRRLPMVRELG